MQIQQENLGAVHVVTIDDHLDTSTSNDFELCLMALIDNGGRRILVDCAPLEYVNSAGLKVLLTITRKLEQIGGEFMLCALSTNVRGVFEMIGFHRVIKVAPDRESALRIFAAAE